MPFIVQDVIDQGFQKSAAARIESVMSPPQLVSRVGQCLREIFLILSRENPYVLGTQLLVPFGGSGWPRPADCIRAIGARATGTTIANPAIAIGAPIAIVPYDDQGFCAGQPSLTELGQTFIGTGQSIDPTGGDLTVVYARAPIQPAQTTDAIDPLFPPFFADFLNNDMAAFLANQDARAADAQVFLGMKGADLQMVLEWARGQTYELQARFPIVNPPLTNTSGGRQSPAEG